MERVHLTIIGLVQGVYFRADACEVARRLKLNGWVKNDPNDKRVVEAFVEGPRDKIEEFIDWCWKGPESARVEKVEERWEDERLEEKRETSSLNKKPRETVQGFEIRF